MAFFVSVRIDDPIVCRIRYDYRTVADRSWNKRKRRTDIVPSCGLWDCGNGSWVKCTGETCRAAVPRPSSVFPRCSSLAARRAVLVAQDGAVRLPNAPYARHRYWLCPRCHAFSDVALDGDCDL